MGDTLLDDHVHALLRRKAMVDAAVLEAVGEWDARGAWKTAEGTSPRNALMTDAALTPGEAKATVAAARDLRGAAPVAAALASGRLGNGHARLVAAFARRPRIRDQFDAHAEAIIGGAADLSIELVPLY